MPRTQVELRSEDPDKALEGRETVLASTSVALRASWCAQDPFGDLSQRPKHAMSAPAATAAAAADSTRGQNAQARSDTGIKIVQLRRRNHVNHAKVEAYDDVTTNHEQVDIC